MDLRIDVEFQGGLLLITVRGTLAGCGKTGNFREIRNPHYAEFRRGPSALLFKHVSACSCGAFCPLWPRAGTLLPGSIAKFE
jgi:hypothetical protein